MAIAFDCVFIALWERLPAAMNRISAIWSNIRGWKPLPPGKNRILVMKCRCSINPSSNIGFILGIWCEPFGLPNTATERCSEGGTSGMHGLFVEDNIQGHKKVKFFGLQKVSAYYISDMRLWNSAEPVKIFRSAAFSHTWPLFGRLDGPDEIRFTATTWISLDKFGSLSSLKVLVST